MIVFFRIRISFAIINKVYSDFIFTGRKAKLVLLRRNVFMNLCIHIEIINQITISKESNIIHYLLSS